MLPLILALVQLLAAVSVLVTVRCYRSSSQWGAIFLALLLVNLAAGYMLHEQYLDNLKAAQKQSRREADSQAEKKIKAAEAEANDYLQRLVNIKQALSGN